MSCRPEKGRRRRRSHVGWACVRCAMYVSVGLAVKAGRHRQGPPPASCCEMQPSRKHSMCVRAAGEAVTGGRGGGGHTFGSNAQHTASTMKRNMRCSRASSARLPTGRGCRAGKRLRQREAGGRGEGQQASRREKQCESSANGGVCLPTPPPSRPLLRKSAPTCTPAGQARRGGVLGVLARRARTAVPTHQQHRPQGVHACKHACTKGIGEV